MADTAQAKVLVVDADDGLRHLLQQYLSSNGFVVMLAENAVAMDAQLAETEPDVIILDLMMPGEDGLSIARRLKVSCPVPIIMLSARGEDIDRIVGLEVGADDYLAKPFNPRELLARIRAILRRNQEMQARRNQEMQARRNQEMESRRIDGSAGVSDNRRIRFGEFELDLDAQSLSKAGEQISLTSAEFSILQVFTSHPNRVLSRDQLMDMLKGYERDPFDRSIDVRVTRLRRKIETDPAEPEYIRTVWGQGYLFAPKGTHS